MNPILGWLKSRFKISAGTINNIWKSNFHEKSWEKITRRGKRPKINPEDDLDQFDTHLAKFLNIEVPLRLYKTNRKWSADHHVIGHFRTKSLFFWDTRDNQDYDAKNRLLIPGPSPEKLMAEIDRLKENRPYQFFAYTQICFFYIGRLSLLRFYKTTEQFFRNIQRVSLWSFVVWRISDPLTMSKLTIITRVSTRRRRVCKLTLWG